MYRCLLLIALAVFGCNKGDEGETQVKPPDLHVVSLGNEPRRLLRYQAPKGTTTTLEMAVDVEVTAGDMGGPMPTIVMTLAMQVEDVLPTGMKLRTTVVDAMARDKDETRVAPNALTGPLEQIKGIVLTTTMTPTGRLIGTKVDPGSKQLPPTAQTQLAALTASLDQLMMPLPEEPVGVGAVWRNSKPLEQNGMKMIAVNTVSITAITGDKVSYSIETQVHGDDQTIQDSGLSVTVKDITGTGTGIGVIDLRTLALTSELSTEFRSAMQAAGEGSATPMRMAIATHVTPK
ncbi:MAG TPA: DUF6263 family protein [Kofleriaceae bacterium]|nr:DUF6263 family protein [Kofleriaceae bacterium]